MSDREYGLSVLNLAFPQFTEIIEQHEDGALPEENYWALSNYVNGASGFGIGEAEVEHLRVRHGLPLRIFQKAKNLGFVARPKEPVG